MFTTVLLILQPYIFLDKFGINNIWLVIVLHRCNCTIYGISEEKVFDNTNIHMSEYHAIKPEEMTTSIKLKIKENMQIHSHSNCISRLNCTVY